MTERPGLVALLFGRFRVFLDGQRVGRDLHGKAARVFQYLVAHADKPVPKDVLIEQFWPESGFIRGRRGLHQAIYLIRKSIRDNDAHAHVIVFENDAYQVNPRLSVWLDVTQFEQFVQLGQQAEHAADCDRAHDQYAQAESLRTGDFLEDSPYEEWAVAERERLRLVYVDAANRLADLLVTKGNYAEAREVSQRILMVESCDEESHRRIMRCYVEEGHRPLAIRHYRGLVEELDRAYGLMPSPDTVELFHSLTEE